MKLHNQYEVLWDDFKNEDLARIKLIGGKWDGLIYKYDTVSFLEQEDGDAILKFDYEVTFTPEGVNTDSLTENDQKVLEDLLGDILVEIVTEASGNEDRADSTNKLAV